MPPKKPEATKLDVIIVGAGVGGLYAIHRLRKLGPEGPRLRGRRAASAAPGSGTAIRAAVATSRAWSTRTRSPTSCSRNGSGPSATARSPRSCATSITSPTASTCGATFSSTRASARPSSTARPTSGRSRPTRARPSRRRYCIMATGNLSTPRMPTSRASRASRASGTTRAFGRMRASISPACGSASSAPARRACRSIPHHRQAGQAPLRLPAHGELQPAGAQRAARSREGAHAQGRISRAPPRRVRHAVRHRRLSAADQVRARGNRGGAAARLRGEMGRGRQHQLPLLL